MTDMAVLGIDLWHTTLAVAVGTTDGRITPVAVDGAAVSPCGVAVTADGVLLAGTEGARTGIQDPHAYVRMPGQALLQDTMKVGAAELDPIEILAACLSTVTREIHNAAPRTPAAVVISTPAGWVARQRRGVRTAAQRAGLGQVRLVTGAESIVREQIARGHPVPVGSVVVVCRLDATVGELVLVQRQSDSFEPMAVLDLGELGQVPGSTLADQAAAALAQALDAAAVTPDQVRAVFCHAPAAMMPELTARLTANAGLPATPMPVAEMAAAFGGARSAALRPEPVGRATPWGRIAAAGFATVIAWSAAAMLMFQMLRSTIVYPATSVGATALVTQWYGWSLAPVFLTLGSVSLVLASAYLRAGRAGAAPARPDPALGSALMTVAVIGLGGATALALITATHFGIEPTPLLWWTVGWSAPLSTILIALGLVVSRVNPPQNAAAAVAWRDRLCFPLSALAAAAMSTVGIVAAYAGVPAVDPDLRWRMEHLGAFILGWAVALLLTRDPWRRMIVGFLLGTTSTYAISLRSAGLLSAGLLGAIALWWLIPLARTITAAFRRPVRPDRSA